MIKSSAPIYVNAIYSATFYSFKSQFNTPIKHLSTCYCLLITIQLTAQKRVVLDEQFKEIARRKDGITHYNKATKNEAGKTQYLFEDGHVEEYDSEFDALLFESVE